MVTVHVARIGLARAPETVDLDIDHLAKLRHQIADMRPSAAVHLRWIFTRQQPDSHTLNVREALREMAREIAKILTDTPRRRNEVLA